MSTIALRSVCRPAAAALSLLAFALLAGCAAPLPPRAEVPHGSGLLWQVDKPGFATSYVFGTFHVTDFKVRNVPQAVSDALMRASQAAFELDDNEEKKAEDRRLYLYAGLLPKDQSLDSLLDADSYAKVLRYAEDNLEDGPQLGRYHISRFKPWFVMEMIDGGGDGPRRFNPLALTLDNDLEARAREAGKTIFSLETAEEHIDVFNGLSMDDQVAMLKARLADYRNDQSYWTSRSVYLEGDTAMMYAIWQRDLATLEPGVAGRFAERMLDGRNRIMVERMVPLFAKAPTFIGVGSLHLPGENGVLSRLEREGFTVTRLH